MIITAAHFNPVETQPYIIYWLQATGIQIGDDVPLYEYQIWNSQQIIAFYQSINVPANTPLHYIENGSQRFGAFLKDLAEAGPQMKLEL